MENLRLDSELPNKMASLDLWESTYKMESEDPHSSLSIRRSSRRKVQSPSNVTNRRVILKPRKRQFKMSMTEDELRNYYCNQKVKNSTPQTLETIFEEPKAATSNTTVLIGNRKIKRALTFHDNFHTTKEKIKKRRSKIKRLLGSKGFLNRKKLSMQSFMEKLQILDPEEPPKPSFSGLINKIDQTTETVLETEDL